MTTLGAVAREVGDYDEALSFFSEASTILVGLGNRKLSADCLEGLASVAARQRQPERAATLFGAAHSLREGAGAALSPSERPIHNHYLAAAREQLDDTTWNRAWAKGQIITMEGVVSYSNASPSSRGHG